MEKKNIDWGNLGFSYIQTDKRYVSNYKDGAWDEGTLTSDATVQISECAGVLQYAQTVFEGLKAYTTEDGHIVTFRPDLNAARLESSAKRLEIPVFPQDRFIESVEAGCPRECRLCAALRFRCNFIHPSLHVWQQRCYRCKACR